MSASTIAAIATAPGLAGVAVVRVSGPDAFAVFKRLSKRCPEPGRIAFVDLGVDKCVVLCFKGPRSYTGEDVVEFQCHGGSVTPRRVLEAVLSAGAVMAGRGEFTKRAYLNGKLDYEQAESVLALIEAKTDRAADSALEGLAGRRSKVRRELYETALGISTELEHALDVNEDELPPDFLPSLRARADEFAAALHSAIEFSRRGKILRDGALVVLAGAPNAGKSSLMNALLGENRVIVSEIPGTTRDSIEEWLDLDGWPVRLVDTAGVRKTGDSIEREGVDRAKALIERADVVIRFVGSEDDPGVECEEKKTIRILAKCDLNPKPPTRSVIPVSSKTGEGLDTLKRELANHLSTLVPSKPIPDADQLVEIAGLVEWSDDIVLFANRMRLVAERLGALIGAVYSADLLDNLFSKFCVGK